MPEHNHACNYEYEDDDLTYYVNCSLPKGHEGNHHATLEFDWPTKPIDICKEQGHVWGEWHPYEAPMRQDIFDVLMASLMGGGKWKVTKAATVQRQCERCKSWETDSEGEWETPPVSFLNSIPRVGGVGGSMTWVEDRLNPEGNRE